MLDGAIEGDEPIVAGKLPDEGRAMNPLLPVIDDDLVAGVLGHASASRCIASSKIGAGFRG